MKRDAMIRIQAIADANISEEQINSPRVGGILGQASNEMIVHCTSARVGGIVKRAWNGSLWPLATK